MTSENNSLSDEIMWQALAEQARNCTYCLIDRTDMRSGGTAVAIKVENRLFFATAKHVINNGHSLEVLPHNSSVIKVLDFICQHFDENLDIGILEIDSSYSEVFHFITQDDIHTKLDPKQELPVLVVGYPGQFHIFSKPIHLKKNNLMQVISRYTLSYKTVILPISEWPKDGIEPPLFEEQDILIDFHPGPKLKLLANIGRPVSNPTSLDPHGLSGAGIWLAQVIQRNGLLFPSSRLVGIQTGYFSSSGWLRGVQIKAWLNLLRLKYPNLKI
jgi:hypothetical protein